jgi:hypothetical protein
MYKKGCVTFTMSEKAKKNLKNLKASETPSTVTTS